MLNTATVPIAVPEGGSGKSSITAYSLICGGTTTTGILQTIAALGTSGQFLFSNGAGVLPTMQDPNTTLVGTTTNNNASAGNLGEYMFSSIASASAVSLSNAITSNITSITLTGGDWIIYGQVAYIFDATTSVSIINGGVATTSGALPNSSNYTASKFTITYSPAQVPNATDQCYSLSPCRQSVSGSTPIYLLASCNFSVSTLQAYGWIAARRRR